MGVKVITTVLLITDYYIGCIICMLVCFKTYWTGPKKIMNKVAHKVQNLFNGFKVFALGIQDIGNGSPRIYPHVSVGSDNNAYQEAST
jgi:hypothetical protein